MAQVMHETTVSKPSVAERKCLQIIDLKLYKEDENLVRYMRIWEEEVTDRKVEENPNRYSFYTFVVWRGRWAADIVSRLPADIFPETGKMLASCIADGWVNAKDIVDEEYFADVIRKWRGAEIPMMANTIRSSLKFRITRKDKHAEIARRIVRFLRSGNDELLLLDESVYRTMFKALGNYAEMTDIIRAAQSLHTTTEEQT